MIDKPESLQRKIRTRSAELLNISRHTVHAKTDRLFAVLMALQWAAMLFAAFFISPKTWSGSLSATHIHVWTALVLGGLISVPPILLAIWRPGARLTRYAIASAQMLTSALLIHLSGGRIETHFHVFGSLAFLSAYRDWRVFVPATLVIAADHMLRGMFWPESVFGIVGASQWRWVEHAAWVIFEDIILVYTSRQNAAEMVEVADRRAELEATNEIIELKVDVQTEAIRSSEALFRSLSASSPMGVFCTNSEGSRWIYANDRCAAILGVQPERLIAEELASLIFEEDRQQVSERWRSAVESRSDFSYEFRVGSRKNNVRWVHVRATRMEATNDGWVGTIEDVTARLEAQRRATTLGRIVEDSNNEIYLFDAETHRFTQVNRGARENLGYTMMELEQLTPVDLEPENSESKFRPKIDRLLSGNEEWLEFDTVHKRKNGSIYPVDVRLQLAELDDTQLFFALIKDATARRQADAVRQRMTTALDQAADAVLITDLDGEIVYVNPAFERICGYGSDEVMGQRPSLLKSGVHDDAFYESLWATLKAGEVWSGTFTNRRKDGTLYEEDGTISPIRDDAGTITGYVAVKRDVTQQRALEEQMRSSQKLESIGQLAAGIAHEINTPTQYVGDNTRFLKEAFEDLLVPIESLSGMLENKEAPMPDKQALETLRKAMEEADVEYLTEEIPRAVDQSLDGIRRVTEIVRAMKDFSHPGGEKTGVDLNRAIDSTLTVARNEWKYVAELELDLDPKLGTVPCIPGDFNQVILNMVVNAGHAITDRLGPDSAEKGQIAVRTRRDEEWAEVRISDSGAGIPEENLAKIFDPFFTTKEVGKGTGQGLSISHNIIVKKHGGTLSVESEVGKGTTFVIRIPLVKVDSPEEVPA